jgi:Trk-type K+ transport system membrane component
MSNQRTNHFKKIFNPWAPDSEDYKRLLGLKGIFTYFIVCIVIILLLGFATKYIQANYTSVNTDRMTVEEWYKGVILFWFVLSSFLLIAFTSAYRHKMKSFVIGREYSTEDMKQMASQLRTSEDSHTELGQALLKDLKNQTLQYKDLKKYKKLLKTL